VHIIENPRLSFSITPSDSAEQPDVGCNLLFNVKPETKFVSIRARGFNVGRALRIIERLLIAAHVRAIEERQKTDCANMLLPRVTMLQFSDHAPRPKIGAILRDAVGHARHLEKTVARSPMRLIQFYGQPCRIP